MSRILLTNPSINRVGAASSFTVRFKLNFDNTVAPFNQNGTLTVQLSDDNQFKTPRVVTPSSFKYTLNNLLTSVNGNRVTASTMLKTNMELDIPAIGSEKKHYIRLIYTVGDKTYQSNAVIVSSITRFVFSLKNPIHQQTLPSYVKTQIKYIKKLSTSADISMVIEVTNNALDKTPIWENCTTSVLNDEYYQFKNKIKTDTSKPWAINMRATFSKATVADEFEVSEVYIAYI